MLGLPIAKDRIGFLKENIAGAIAYLTFIPAIVFLTLDPYRRNFFVRFHSVQCLLLWTSVLLVAAALKLAAYVFLFIPAIGALLIGLVSVIAALAAFFLWLVLLIKAFQGYAFKLPILGEIAEHYAV